MFYVPARRYRLRRVAVLRSMPLSSAPNSCAVISRRRLHRRPPDGIAYVPSSRRLLQIGKPVPVPVQNLDPILAPAGE